MSVIEIAGAQVLPSVINVKLGAKLRRYVPERTCHIDMPVIDWEMGETDYKCSACGARVVSK